LHRPPTNENICSIRDRPSASPRDEAIRAALRDVAVLAGIRDDEFRATYEGPERSEYVRVLAAYIADLGGSLETGAWGPVATFADRRIAIRFGR
jgi:hypothetical protein